jgi:MFS family permease
MPYAIAGVVAASAGLALVPQVERFATLVALATVFGGISGIAFVAISVMLAGSATPATRGAVMGGYSTSLYLGLALGSFALGPVITHCGDAVGFAMGAIAGVISTVIAARLWVGDAAERAAEWKVESINSASDVIWPVVTPVACASAAGWNSDLGCQ